MSKDSSNKILKNNLSTLLKRFSKTDVVSTLKESYNPTIVNQISISLLKDLPFFKGVKVSEDRINNRLNLIVDKGITNPLMVYQKGNNYLVITSRTTYYACQKLNKSTIPCIVVDIPEQDLLLMLASHLRDSKNSSIIEIYYVLKELKNCYHYTQNELATIMQVSRSQIANIMRIGKLPENLQDLLNNNVITFTQIRPLLALDNTSIQTIVSQILEKKLSVREIEKLVQNLNNLDNTSEDKNILENLYECDVTIAKSTVSFKCKNEEELASLLEKLKKLK